MSALASSPCGWRSAGLRRSRERAILVLNAGSSSIKFAAFAGREQSSPEDALCDGECEGIGHRVDFAARDGAGNPRIDKHLGGEATTNEDALAAISLARRVYSGTSDGCGGTSGSAWRSRSMSRRC